ncbi:MAG: DUF2330 domain-containing protein [Neomegalonema sp.]|nr:DUF2330 domain-containing protein [Neomegalonema sp.]
MIRSMLAALTATALLAPAAPAAAFCGFFVAKADTKLFNDASKVVMVRDQDRTVITMVNDYAGDPKDFAMVIPTPVVLKRKQINVGRSADVEHLDAYTAPRIVEYRDPDPCAPPIVALRVPSPRAKSTAPISDGVARRQRSLGVKIEAQYTVGEYDILILSAKKSDGLQIWLDENGYKTPAAAKPILASYIAQGMKFFVAKVNLKEKSKVGGEFLRPLQIAFESKKFMLPIRLGTANGRGKQDLILFTLTRTGRVETVNYRTAKIPSNIDIPLFVQKDFGRFYKAMFARASEKAGGRAVFTEYAWDMGWCDPCAADPLSNDQLRRLGVYWVPKGGRARRGVNVFVTRLHVRYDAKTFPEDLRLTVTGDRKNFQGRYVTRHPFTGDISCAAGDAYRRRLLQRWDREAKQLATLTGWDIGEIRAKMAKSAKGFDLNGNEPWWKSIWD